MENKFENLIQDLLDKGFGTVADFLEPGLTDSLRKDLETRLNRGELKSAGTGQRFAYRRNAEVRGDTIFWLDKGNATSSEKRFLLLVDDLVRYLNSTCYAGVRDYEFHYAVYTTGTFYKRHVDQFRSDTGRKYSLVTYLNESWNDSDEGQLVLYHKEGETALLPEGGRTVFFRSDEIEHEVKPATRDRMSIAGWLKV
jgi:SM-20-related protein